jgi:tRNA(fMet)-specific endonuclease VapC
MNGNRVALDTNRAIAVLNGAADAVNALAAISQIELPIAVIAELRYGAMNSQRAAENLALIEQLVAGCGILNATLATAQVYGRVRSELRRRGTPIPENDVWIASACIEHDLPLWTDDHHFSAVTGLRLYTP